VPGRTGGTGLDPARATCSALSETDPRLSIRQIASATGFSSSRVHQLLGPKEARVLLQEAHAPITNAHHQAI
jgi:hypothetical protein